MKAFVEGWARNVGTTTLYNMRLTTKARAEAVYPLPPRTLRITSNRPTGNKLDGAVCVVCQTEREIALNGRYAVSVELSAKEALILAAEVTRDLSIGVIVDELVRLRSQIE